MTRALHVYFFSGDNRGDEPVTVDSETALDDVLADVLANAQPHPSVVYAQGRPTVGPHNFPDHQIKFDVDAKQRLAAMHAFGPESFAAGSSAAVTRCAPCTDVDVSLWIDKAAGVPFPQDSIIPLDKLRQALSEFMATGRRPTCVEWQETDVY